MEGEGSGGAKAEPEPKLLGGSPLSNGLKTFLRGWDRGRGTRQRSFVIHKSYCDKLILKVKHLSNFNVFIIRTYLSNGLLCPYTCSYHTYTWLQERKNKCANPSDLISITCTPTSPEYKLMVPTARFFSGRFRWI